MEKIVPAPTLLLLEPLDEPALAPGGFLGVDDSRSRLRRGKVLDKGVGVALDSGARGYVPLPFQPGDVVLYRPGAGDYLASGGKELLLLEHEEVLARVS